MILSVTPAYTEILVKQGKRSGLLLRNLKANIEEPLAAILTLNTIAHTADAVGAGAQAAIVFGSAGLGVTGPKYSKTLRYIFSLLMIMILALQLWYFSRKHRF